MDKVKQPSVVDVVRDILKGNNNCRMSAKELWTVMQEEGRWVPSKGGKTPWYTIYERVSRDVKTGKPIFSMKGGKIWLTKKGLSDEPRLTDKRKRGFVYVLKNPRSFWRDSWVKIGSSDMDVGSRVYNLNTAVPYNFQVCALMETVGPKKVEDELHNHFEHLGRYGDEDSKEFFTVSVEEVVEEMRLIGQKRTYNSARILTDKENQDEILKILRKSRNDPTKRRPRKKRFCHDGNA